MKLESLIKKIKKYNPNSNIKLIRKAYSFAKKNAEGKKRISGENLIEHPTKVASILADMKMDDQTIIAALLHHIDFKDNKLIESVNEEFGEQIVSLIKSIAMISKLKSKTKVDYNAENIRKVIMASAKDIRVIFVKLADRLHNMKTLKSLDKEDQLRVSKEVMDIYAPIAYKLGMGHLKSELEDLGFMYLQPEVYNDLKKKLVMSQKTRENVVKKIVEKIKKTLKEENIEFIKIFGRPKHIYSIYKKMQKKNRSFENIMDLIAIRIITESVKECYQIVGILHNLWKPIPQEFDDYIAMPKSNMYQSLHTVVIGPKGQTVEIQVRTEDMDRVAEEGVAAHWSYKGIKGDVEFDNKLSWMKQILEWQKDSGSNKEFMEMLKLDFFEDEIFTFTPKGEVIRLPKGSTVVDFAYSIHTNVGEKCTGAKINNEFKPVRTILKNGDQIEIITSKTQNPSRSWLKFVRTSKAKSKIKNYILKTQGIPARGLVKSFEQKKELEEWIIEVENNNNLKIKIAKCCLPLPGDQIIGVKTSAKRITVHKKGCNLVKKGANKLKAGWKDIDSDIDIKVDALNRVGLFAEILNTIVRTKAEISSAKAKSLSKDIVECSFNIKGKNLDELQDLIKRIYKLNGVKKVYIGDLN